MLHLHKSTCLVQTPLQHRFAHLLSGNTHCSVESGTSNLLAFLLTLFPPDSLTNISFWSAQVPGKLYQILLTLSLIQAQACLMNDTVTQVKATDIIYLDYCISLLSHHPVLKFPYTSSILLIHIPLIFSLHLLSSRGKSKQTFLQRGECTITETEP